MHDSHIRGGKTSLAFFSKYAINITISFNRMTSWQWLTDLEKGERLSYANLGADVAVYSWPRSDDSCRVQRVHHKRRLSSNSTGLRHLENTHEFVSSQMTHMNWNHSDCKSRWNSLFYLWDVVFNLPLNAAATDRYIAQFVIVQVSDRTKWPPSCEWDCCRTCNRFCCRWIKSGKEFLV